MVQGKIKTSDSFHKNYYVVLCESIFSTGWMLAFFPCLGFLLSTLFFFFHISISIWLFLLSFFLTILILLFYNGDLFGQLKNKIFSIILFIVIIGLSVGISGHFYDQSYDGLWYHQSVSIELLKGWNPIYESYPDNTESRFFQLIYSTYPKSFETIVALFSTITGFIETGKAINFIFLFAGIILGYEVLTYYLPSVSKPVKIILALILGINPVLLSQIFSNYVDGMGGSILTLLILSILIYEKKSNYLYLLLTIGLVLTGLSVKFLSIYYIFIIIISYLFYLFITHDSRLNNFTLSFAIIFILGILLFGYNPYIISYTNYGNPLYGLLGEEIGFTGAMPPIMVQLPPFVNLLVSIFSKSSNLLNQEFVDLKIPFTFSNEELLQFTMNDVRIGGFGPMTSGILLLSLVISALLFCWHREKIFDKKDNILLLTLTGGILASIILNPISWWARYAPQLWLLFGLIGLLSLMITGKNGKYSLYVRLFTYVLLVFMIINLILITPFIYDVTSYHTTNMNHFLEEAQNHQPVYIQSAWDSIIHKLEYNNISYEYVQEFPEKTATLKIYENNIGIKI